MIFKDDDESIDDIARGEGFFIDDDGNWVPLEDAYEYGYEAEDLDYEPNLLYDFEPEDFGSVDEFLDACFDEWFGPDEPDE